MDKGEEMMPPAQEKEKQDEEEKEIEEEEEADVLEGEDDDAADEEAEKEGDDEEQKGGDEQEVKAIPRAAEKKKKRIPLPKKKTKEKKKDEVLNLNNEVVRMRKEVKRVRALAVRRLTRQIAALKKKKGKEMEIERNRRRAARLLEELHAMKTLSPDLVTKTALQKSLHFEQVCKDPKSTISDRATARIATHPQFNKKIEEIKAAVKAFKEERMKGGKQRGKEKVQNKGEKVTPQSAERKIEKEEEDVTVEQKDILDKEEGDDILKDTEDATVAEPEKETVRVSSSADTVAGQRKEMPEARNVRSASVKGSEGKDAVENPPQAERAEKKPDLKLAPEVLQKKEDEEESDLEASGDEEKEYFDDSTEERFHKQSFQSEESDDGFFVGKVSKFKKKKKKTNTQESVEGDKADEGREGNSSDRVQRELDELESRLRSKGTSLQSVFCSSLASSKPGGGRGAGRGRGGDRFRGRGKPKGGGGLDRDFSKQPKFQRQERGAERHPGSKYSKSESFPSVGRGRGRGRGGGGGRGAFTHQAPQQALHPSWEASKKRKEQHGQILAFQGKKIKFDDDD
ncbi:serum response factor-binding protein 1 [Cebidichthys violaceus]|uniref:serum response factor-binding protein 1 n=1 Tax=Cebidichthys violaceus TaxID=271503 RepID=UPI0035CAC9E7